MGKFAAWTVLLALILYYIRRDVLHYPDMFVRGAEHTDQQADTENRNSASLLLKKSADFDKKGGEPGRAPLIGGVRIILH